MESKHSDKLVQFSLRELLVGLGVAALGLAAMRYGGVLRDLLQTGCAVLVIFAMISALVDHGRRRAFAIGFVIAALAYSGLLFLQDGREFNFLTARFATSKMLRPIRESMVTERWVGGTAQSQNPGVSAAPRQGMAVIRSAPGAGNLLRAGHTLWTLFFGYLGGKAAVLVYYRRCQETREHADLPA